MEPKLIFLKLFLDELGISCDIDTVEDRKRVQKAVYLGQLSGVDLGYLFGWYLMGPYCTRLTNDYYELEKSIKLGEKDYKNMELQPSIKKKLGSVSGLFQKPDGSELKDEEWLELVASCHYLRTVRELSEEDARSIIKEEKPRLAGSQKTAESKLKDAGLLGS